MLIIILNFLIILFSFNLIAMTEEEGFEKLLSVEKSEKLQKESS